MLWGSETRPVELFGPRAHDIRSARRIINFRYRSPAHWIDVFRTYYGPTLKAYASLSEPRARELDVALTELLSARNVAQNGTLVVPGEYLEAVIVKA